MSICRCFWVCCAKYCSCFFINSMRFLFIITKNARCVDSVRVQFEIILVQRLICVALALLTLHLIQYHSFFWLADRKGRWYCLCKLHHTCVSIARFQWDYRKLWGSAFIVAWILRHSDCSGFEQAKICSAAVEIINAPVSSTETEEVWGEKYEFSSFSSWSFPSPSLSL